MPHPYELKLLRSTYLRGPNVWTYRPVLETWLDLGELEELPSHRLPGFNDRLLAWLPSLEEHHCGVGERGGFIQRLREGTWAGHVLEHIVIELLNLAGMPTGFGQTRSTSRTGVYRMVFRARDERVARAALAEGHALIGAAINNQPSDLPFDVPAAVKRIREQVDRCYLGPSTASIVAAAADRGIPHIRLNDGNLVQLGYGARQRRIWTAETEQTSAIAEGIASDKDLTKQLLRACGVPVPEGRVVSDAADAWDAAEDIGTPVVVKPSDANHGRGVSIELTTREQVEAAFAVADAEGSDVIVERFVPGQEHRLLVVGNRMVAASRGDAACVTGDGRSSIAELVATQLNTDPRRGEDEIYPLDIVRIDEPAVLLELQRQGCTPETVPAPGRVVRVLRNGNLAIDVTDDVHPSVAEMATLAARVVGLDIAGIDLLAQDISRPLEEQGGAIVEVNAGPGLLMHLKPAEGSPRPVGRAIVDHLFPEADDEQPGRIPVVGVAGSQGTALIARWIAWLLHLSGRHVGLACSEGLFFDRRAVERGDRARFEPAHRLLMNRAMEAAVIENGAATILRDGLPYDRCAVGIVTDLDGTAGLAEFDITESEQLVRVLRTQIDVVLPTGVGVLHAADARIAQLAELCDGEVLLYAADWQLPALAAHREAGGRVVCVRDGQVVLARGSAEQILAPLARLAGGSGTAPAVAAEAVLAVVAGAWALDIAPDLIAAGIETVRNQATPHPASV
ncbi:MAG: cyanophycin synthetase [Burkholderiales bacterium]|nr:cyanophycin synthetase [Burkholderiales bacterium]